MLSTSASAGFPNENKQHFCVGVGWSYWSWAARVTEMKSQTKGGVGWAGPGRATLRSILQ